MCQVDDEDIVTTPIPDDVAKRLGLSQDRTQSVCWSYVTDDDLSYLVNIPQLQTLNLSGKYLGLCCRKITDAGLVHIAGLTQLKELKLGSENKYHQKFTDTGLVYLKGLTRLQKLDLSLCNELTDAGLAHLRGLVQLRELNLSHCWGLTNAGLVRIVELTQLTQLKWLGIRGCGKLTKEAVMELKATIPSLTIES